MSVASTSPSDLSPCSASSPPCLGGRIDYLLPVLAAVWVVIVRWPSFDLHIAAMDEAFFLLMGNTLLHGAPPYTALYDVKPPGLVVFYAALQALFPPGFMAARIAAAIGVWLATCALMRLVRHHLGNRPAVVAIAILYPAYSMVLEGLSPSPEALLAPLLIFALDLAFRAWREGRRSWPAPPAAGLLMGVAVLFKQSAVFELAYALCLFAGIGGARLYPKAGAMFLAAACLPSVAYAACSLLARAPVYLMATPFVAPLYRMSGDGITFGQGLLRFLPMMKPVLPLYLAALTIWLAREHLHRRPEWAGLRLVVLWLVPTTLGIVAMRAMYHHYYVTLLPPLVALLAYGLGILWQRAEKTRWIAIAVVVAAAVYPFAWRALVERADDRSATLAAGVAAHLQAEGISHDDTIYVVDTDPAIYLLTGAKLPSRYAYPQHLICDFHLPDTDAMAELKRIMEERPRYVVLAEPGGGQMICEKPDRLALIDSYLRRFYRHDITMAAGGEAVDVFAANPAP